MLRPDFTKQEKTSTAKEKAAALQTEIYSLASDMPKADCPSIATQMSDSITRVTEYLYMIEDSYINQNYNPKHEFLQHGIKVEIKMLTLLSKLAHERIFLMVSNLSRLVIKLKNADKFCFYHHWLKI